ncbi:exosome complex component CSL4-like [Psammomys obesus]|uniref:exosome complex component CSL4-like n=1 Tax=Psammomys obesus TaxID=48139 RepID=UPI00245325C1|nr:exosome complex component CSL4-like [Psammomys obesus]
MWDPHHLKTLFKELSTREISEQLKVKIEICKRFNPGDIVLEKVSFLGNAQPNYLLSTAENKLVVGISHGGSGVQMAPISWCKMQCPKTHKEAFQKVARVQPECLQS